MTTFYQCGDRDSAAYPESNHVARELGRPVVVIDPEDDAQVDDLREALCLAQSFAEFQDALREFARPAPKLEEPTGLGAVVEDAEGYQWVRLSDPRGKRWYRDNAWEAESDWAEIDAVKVLSPGVTVE